MKQLFIELVAALSKSNVELFFDQSKSEVSIVLESNKALAKKPELLTRVEQTIRKAGYVVGSWSHKKPSTQNTFHVAAMKATMVS